ncbi:MAG: anti-sigma factor [Cocleimonas sp.]|nr:anti-sigma factor [Cocleimonas sp.]
MSSIKRYQNPEIFEQLAMEYAVGGLHGRAKKRFETLMETHFYLKATVEAYEYKFAHLVELLPDEKPSDQLWENINAQIKIDAQPAEVKITSWWHSLFNTKVYGLVASALIISAILLFNPMTGSPIAYTAVLESSTTHTAMAVTRISQADMQLSIDMMKHPDIPDNMELHLWCHPKDGGKPVMMGAIAKSGETIIHIDKAEWRSFKNVGLLAVSIEPKGKQSSDGPRGEVLLEGQLSSIHET